MHAARLSVRRIGARLAAAALSLPILLAGGATPALAAHSMSPSTGGLVQYQEMGDVQALANGLPPCVMPTAPVPCYGPDKIRAAYNVQPLLDSGITGAGQTIVIVDAFSSPFIWGDLAKFDSDWGLPPASLDILYPQGHTPFDFSRLQMGWAIEISLDVEWAHAIAPDAHLVLVLSATERDTDMLHATEFAIDHQLGDVITQSFGESENCADPALLREEHAAFERAASRGITLVAGAGDFGATNLLCDGSGVATVASASTPASDPDVTAVGGTRLMLAPDGAYGAETGWGDFVGASGGGFSSIYKRPGYQAPFINDNSARGLPDVAYSADFFGSTLIVFGGRYGAIIGTSVGTPEWAAITALSEQAAGHRLPQLNIRLYHLAKSQAYAVGLHDVTTGNNSFAGVEGFSAAPGWDAVTGLGTPNVAQLVPLIT